MNTAFAEVVASSLTLWTAQCWKYDHVLPLGSLVACHTKPTTYAFITNIMCQNPGQQARAYQKTPEQLRAEYPHLSYYLTTTIECVPICWQSGSKLLFQLPGVPAPLHTFIEPAPENVYSAIMQADQWLPALCGSMQGHPLFDELLLAILHQALEKRALTRKHLDDIAHTYASITGNNYQRIKTFLQRLELLIH